MTFDELRLRIGVLIVWLFALAMLVGFWGWVLAWVASLFR